MYYIVQCLPTQNILNSEYCISCNVMTNYCGVLTHFRANHQVKHLLASVTWPTNVNCHCVHACIMCYLPTGRTVAVSFIFKIGHISDHPVVDLRQGKSFLGCALNGSGDELRVGLVSPRVPPWGCLGFAQRSSRYLVKSSGIQHHHPPPARWWWNMIRIYLKYGEIKRQIRVHLTWEVVRPAAWARSADQIRLHIHLMSLRFILLYHHRLFLISRSQVDSQVILYSQKRLNDPTSQRRREKDAVDESASRWSESGLQK